MTVKRPFQARAGARRASSKESPASKPTVPRVARLMALAIRFDQLIRDGVVTDQAELARIGQVSRARLTQIMNLSNLNPDIQEDLLGAFTEQKHSCVLSERSLRALTAELDWNVQRRLWSNLARGAQT